MKEAIADAQTMRDRAQVLPHACGETVRPLTVDVAVGHAVSAAMIARERVADVRPSALWRWYARGACDPGTPLPPRHVLAAIDPATSPVLEKIVRATACCATCGAVTFAKSLQIPAAEFLCDAERLMETAGAAVGPRAAELDADPPDLEIVDFSHYVPPSRRCATCEAAFCRADCARARACAGRRRRRVAAALKENDALPQRPTAAVDRGPNAKRIRQRRSAAPTARTRARRDAARTAPSPRPNPRPTARTAARTSTAARRPSRRRCAFVRDHAERLFRVARQRPRRAAPRGRAARPHGGGGGAGARAGAVRRGRRAARPRQRRQGRRRAAAARDVRRADRRVRARSRHSAVTAGTSSGAAWTQLGAIVARGRLRYRSAAAATSPRAADMARADRGWSKGCACACVHDTAVA